MLRYHSRLLGAAFLIALAFGVPQASGQEPKYKGLTLIVAGSQTDTNNLVMNAIKGRFEKETGASLQMVPGTPESNLSRVLAAQGRTPPFHVVMLEKPTEARAIEAKVIQKIDYGKIPTAAQLPKQAFPHPGYGVAFIFFRQSICINAGQYRAHNVKIPDGIEGLFDPAIAGRLLLPAPANNWWAPGLSAIAQHYGVSLEAPDKLFERLESAKPASFYTSSGDAQARLQSGAVWLSTSSDGRCFGLKLAGQPVEFIPLNLNIGGKTYKWAAMADTWNIPAGVEGPLFELAHIFMEMTLAPEAILPMVRKYGFIPTNPEALRQAMEFPEFKQAGVFADFSFDSMYSMDTEAFLPHLNTWLTTWNRRFLK